MIMNPGMLFFGLLASFVAFYLVYSIAKAKFGGTRSTVARSIGAVLGIIVFIIYFATIVWFNTQEHTVPDEVKAVVYAAPFVFTILMTVLVFLSQPPKKKTEEEITKEETEKNEKEASTDN